MLSDIRLWWLSFDAKHERNDPLILCCPDSFIRNYIVEDRIFGNMNYISTGCNVARYLTLLFRFVAGNMKNWHIASLIVDHFELECRIFDNIVNIALYIYVKEHFLEFFATLPNMLVVGILDWGLAGNRWLTKKMNKGSSWIEEVLF